MLFKNIINDDIVSSILDLCYITKEHYKKHSILLWENDEKKKGLTLKLYGQTIDLKNYILKVSWSLNNDLFEVSKGCTDFAQSIGFELTKKVLELMN